MIKLHSLLLFAIFLFAFLHPASSLECDYPLKLSSDGKTCTKPCPGTLAWKPQTQSCFPACLAPFVEKKVNGVRVCEPLCSKDQLFNLRYSNCTERCQEPMFEATNEGVRVCKMPCSPGKYYRPEDKTCHSHCPNPWKPEMKNGVEICQKPCDNSKPFWSPSFEFCIKACEDPLVSETIDGIQTCRFPCASPEEFWNTETRKCTKTCSQLWSTPDLAWDQVYGKACSKPCREDEFYIDYDQMCVPECPKPLLPQTKDGVKHCAIPCNAREFYNIFTEKCISRCLTPSKPSQSYTGQICISWCQPSEFHVSEYSCVKECPYPQIQEKRAEDGVQFCKPACSERQIWDPETDRCVDPCPPEQVWWDPEAKQCVNECPEMRVIQTVNNRGACMKPCPEGRIYIPAKFYNEGTCPLECPGPLKKHTVNSVDVCKNPCQEGEAWSEETKSCSKTCLFPKNAVYKKIVLSEQRFANSGEKDGFTEILFCEYRCDPISEEAFWVKETQSCQKECPQGYLPEVVANAKFCKPACPPHQFYHTQNQACQDTCPWPWASQTSRTLNLCTKPCQEDQVRLNFDIPKSREYCMTECPFPSVLEIVDGIKLCQKPCHFRQVWDNTTKSCRNSCPLPLAGLQINGIDSCVPVCPEGEFYIHNPPKCVPNCSEPYVADFSDGFKSCRYPCLEKEVFDPETKTCMMQCPEMRRKKNIDGIDTCVKVCPENQFYYGLELLYGGYYSDKCSDECQEPFITGIEAGVKVCQRHHCEPGLLWIESIGKCVSSCPKTHKRDLGRFPKDICWPICEDPSGGYDPKTGRCNVCSFPKGRMNGVPVCKVECWDQRDYWNEVTETCEKLCPEPFKIETKVNVRTCSKPCNDSEFYIWESKTCQQSCPDLWVPDFIEGILSCKKL